MTHATPRPLVLGDTRNEYNDGYAWVVPVWADVSPNCIYAEARHENRTEARKRAALIVHAVNTLDEAKAALCLAGQVLDSMLNGQGLEADNMDKALMAINHAIAKMDAQ